MATPPFNIANTAPADTDIVSQYPADERSNRDVIESYLNTAHDFNTGHHNVVGLVDQVTDPAALLFPQMYNVGGKISIQTAAGVINTVVQFLPGVKHLFPQAAVPVGWVLDTDVNDALIRVNATTGAGTGGSWTISGLTIASHVLVISEMPVHNHQYRRPNDPSTLASGDGRSGNVTVSENQTTTNAGSGGGHAHGVTFDGAWRPKYLDTVKGSIS